MKEKAKHIIANTHWQQFLKNENDFEAYANVYNLHINDLLSYGTSLGFDEDTCRDASQDVFYKLFIGKKKLTGVKNITAYLFRTYRNHLFDIKKGGSKLADHAVESAHFASEITVLELIESREEADELKKIVENLLNELTPRQREAIYLRYMQELEYDEIAQLLDMNSNSVRRLVSRGMENLRSKTDIHHYPLLLMLFLISCNPHP